MTNRYNYDIIKTGGDDVYLYCANNNKIYRSIIDAADDLKINRSCIYRFLNGERKTAANFVFAKIDNISAATKKLRQEMLLNNLSVDLKATDLIIYKKE